MRTGAAGRGTRKRRVLFLQLPVPDPEGAAAGENRYQAAACLDAALRAAGEGRHYETCLPPPEWERLGNAALAEAILAAQPDVLACSLYAWNVERTLRVLRTVRAAAPAVTVVAGGPEVALPHPFLLRGRVIDAVVIGEGEAVFPVLMRALRTGGTTDFDCVGWRTDGGYRFGSRRPEPLPLARVLPPPSHPWAGPDARGMAWMETTRGCPARCAFCAYGLYRRRVSALPVADVLRRVRALRRRGAVEIRFLDPTFNAHPAFDQLLAGLARLNADGSLRFFAEVRADRITDREADLLRAANVREVEVGVQSGDPRVLRRVRRPGRDDALQAGIERLASRGIELTLDVMCGLPGQGLADVQQCLQRLCRVAGARVQLLHTLLLPGCELRARRHSLRLSAQSRPPYRVLRTPHMRAADMAQADVLLAEAAGVQLDSPVRRYVGVRLPDVFADPDTVVLGARAGLPPGRWLHRAVLVRADCFWSRRQELAAQLGAAVRREPDTVWQFVLCMEAEDPLDVLDAAVGALRRAPSHYLDRLQAAGRHVARRLFVKLHGGRRYDPDWIGAAEDLLRGHGG